MTRKAEAKQKRDAFQTAIQAGYHRDGFLGAVKAWFVTLKELLSGDYRA